MAEFKNGPNINYGPDKGGEGSFESSDAKQKRRDERARLLGERAGVYPIEGSDIVELLADVEIGKGGDTKEIELAAKETLAYREGLKFGPNKEAYLAADVKDQSSIIYLQNLFTSVEGAISRPRSPYIGPALEEAIGQRVRESGRYESNPGGWELKQKRKYGKINREREIIGIDTMSPEEIDERIKPQRDQLKYSIEARPALRKLENSIEARKIIDAAFIQRMATCEDPVGSSEIAKTYGIAVSPDKGHWRAFFQNKETEEPGWGKRVNKVFWRIVSFGLPDDVVKDNGLEVIPSEIRKIVKRDIYSTSFEKTKEFESWINYLLEGADGNMDVVWAAWRVALLWEVPNELGLSIKRDEKGENPKWKIPFPPIGSALHSFSAHVEAKRALEFGLKADGTEDRANADKFISHSGLPMSLGKFPSLCRSFLHESVCEFSHKEIIKRKEKMEKLIKNLPTESSHSYFSNMHEVDRKYHASRYEGIVKDIKGILEKSEEKKVRISLWELGLFAGIGFDSEEFPWTEIEESLEGEETGEIAPGGFSSWLLRRSRSWSIIKDIRSRPSLSDIANPDYFNDGSRVRNWSKVLGVLKTSPSADGYVAAKDNPRAWWLAGLLWYHRGGGSATSKITRESSYRNHRTFSRREVFKQKEAGHVEGDKGGLLGDILKHAEDSGFIRREDTQWILSDLQIKTRMF